MLDLNYVRDHLAVVEEKLRRRGMDPAEVMQDFHQVDAHRRQAITRAETLKAQRNRASEEIARLKKERRDAESLIAESKQLREQIQQQESAAAEAESDLRHLLESIPNLPHDSVPVGTTAEDNVEVRRWGQPPQFDFTPRPHWELGEQLGILDFERAAKISGARFAVYMEMGARLERALANFMLDLHTREHGYTEVLPPFLVRRGALRHRATSQVRGGSVPRAARRQESLSDSHGRSSRHQSLSRRDPGRQPPPDLLTAWTPCFRSEAGSYGKDTRGFIRQHQFQKVELVKFALPENSYEDLEQLTHDAETMLQRLGLHYRVVALCTGDMGFSSAKTYDLEVWLPGQQ